MAHPKFSDSTIGERIRDRRKLLGLSIRSAAQRAGLPPTTWSRLERGERPADNRFTLAAIAEALRCPVSALAKPPHPANRTEAETSGSAYETVRAALHVDLEREATEAKASITAALRELDLVCDLRSRCDYAAAARRLPALLHGLHTAAFGPDRTEALRGLVIAEHVASLTLRYLNEPTGSYLVAERAQKAAEALDEPVMLGLAAFTRSHAAIASGLWTRALTIAGQAAEELRPHLARPEAPEVYGQLLLTQAYCRYAVDHTDEAADLVTEAGRIADHTGETTTLGLMFGPTNINFWRIAMEADGDSPGRAVEIARRTHPQAVASISRQATFHLDTARALARIGRVQEALRSLLTVERMAPQRMRSPLVVETTRGLLARARRGAGWTELPGLSRRLGVEVT